MITQQRIQTYVPPIESEDENLQETTKSMIAAMPFSIIGSVDDVTTPDGRVVKGREYIWGVAEGGLGRGRLSADNKSRTRSTVTSRSSEAY